RVTVGRECYPDAGVDQCARVRVGRPGGEPDLDYHVPKAAVAESAGSCTKVYAGQWPGTPIIRDSMGPRGTAGSGLKPASVSSRAYSDSVRSPPDVMVS